MTLEQATLRLAHFHKVREEMKATRKCPIYKQSSLTVEGGEWGNRIPDWVYYANRGCDFTDLE